ncbi:hypothetical protein EIN_185580 [Entamoeba invadens IP1]|uniref:hypothetical protein n=1 Tax=Entamoeba invadens IP1 TaxID=370355 RepID=UPI0002C3F7B4|nr:hypothetical protein EIN_185580 [Entamoeba invadens IP1]ELP94161.1 hypothetical protein EIN_185580 [Entamoeba invadens IP1]|eukprot:XP_004260932.1 hypothetical protein EIN_185580 [Entamoeba invadens IP1]
MSTTNSESIIIPSQCIGNNVGVSDYPSIVSVYSAVSVINNAFDDVFDSGSMAAQQIQGTESSSHLAYYGESSMYATDCSSNLDKHSSKISSNLQVEDNIEPQGIINATVPEEVVPHKEIIVHDVAVKSHRVKKGDKPVVVVKEAKPKELKDKHKKRSKK